jgi:hypothetical protein
MSKILNKYLNHLNENEDIPFDTGYDKEEPEEFGDDYNEEEGQPDEEWNDDDDEFFEPDDECEVDEQVGSCAAGIGGWETMGNNPKERRAIK